MTTLTRPQMKLMRKLDFIEKEALKKCLPNDVYAVTQAGGQETIERLIARGWEVVKDNEAAYGKIMKIATMRIDRATLEARS